MTKTDPNNDFQWVTKQLAVGGCYASDGAAALASEHGITAIIDLRAEDCDDEALLRAAGISLLHLPTPDLEPPTHDHLELGVEFARARLAAGEKVLIHCQHGIGRSALLALCVMVDQGWAPLGALSQAKDRREAISPSRSQFDGWCAWLQSRGFEAPDYHSFGCIAYRHLAQG